MPKGSKADPTVVRRERKECTKNQGRRKAEEEDEERMNKMLFSIPRSGVLII
jgi:hypothetical protein